MRNRAVFAVAAGLLATAILGLGGALHLAHAANLAVFGQTSHSNTLVATTNGANTQTTLTIDNAAIDISQLISGAPPVTTFFDLHATSNDAAVPFLGAVIQHYDGSFCLTSAINCGGVNVLSGQFSDAAFGAIGGPGLVINVNNPPDTLTLTSDIIPATDLAAPNALSLGFTNIPDPGLHIVGTTIAPLTASFAGTVSAQTVPVSEPGSLAVFGGALVLMAGVLRLPRRRL
jgi:hypothetical protein